MGNIRRSVKSMIEKSKLARRSYMCVRNLTSEIMRDIPLIRKSHAVQKFMAKLHFAGRANHSEFSGTKRICYYESSKAEQIASMLSMIDIHIEPDKRFQCWIDEGLITSRSFRIIDNMPPNYELVIRNSLEELIERFDRTPTPTAKDGAIILRAMCTYIDRTASALEAAGTPQTLHSAEIFRNMKAGPALTFEEALQRILLWSSVFWQSHHRLIGLGRLDKILAHLSAGNDDRTERVNMIRDFCDALHKHYGFKSNRVSRGDTGQIIILGGLDPDGKYFVNDLTYDFITAFTGHKIPDPKLLLRVSSKMPDELLSSAVKCIATGVGCPLLSNDDIVIPALEDFGYSHEDACNYVTSACWEPLAYGKSLEQNNLADINYARVIAETYQDKTFAGIKDFGGLLSLYKSKLSAHISRSLEYLDTFRWEEDPLMSMFTESCIETGRDISCGGAVYNNYGLLTVGMSNAVNSLLNMKHMLFGTSGITAGQVRLSAVENHKDEALRAELEAKKYFGHDGGEVISLTRELVEFTAEHLKDYRNSFGGRVKFGLSSPNYIELGLTTPATLDGRRAGQPLGVHISNPKGVAYTELVMFASNLNYSGIRSNGNVLDYFVPPAIINDEQEKFLMFLKAAIVSGFFQMQMNVTDSAELIDAKKNPGKYPDLIVRVWGFSAYFDELPEEYKDVLIERALACEGKTA